MKGGGRAPPPSPAWANFTLMMECTPESSHYYSVYSVVRAYHHPYLALSVFHANNFHGNEFALPSPYYYHPPPFCKYNSLCKIRLRILNSQPPPLPLYIWRSVFLAVTTCCISDCAKNVFALPPPSPPPPPGTGTSLPCLGVGLMMVWRGILHCQKLPDEMGDRGVGGGGVRGRKGSGSGIKK